jgi:hypothetical protein
MADQGVRNRLIDLVTRLVNANFEGGEEAKEALLLEIEALVPAANVIDLIYFAEDEDTPEVLADKLSASRPLILPIPPDATRS